MRAKVVAKLELHPINAGSARALEDAFEDAEKLVRVCHRYFAGALGARSWGDGYPKLTVSDIKVIRSAARALGVSLPSDTVTETIKRVHSNFEVSGVTFGSRPRKINPFIPIRVSKVTRDGKEYRRSLTIEEVKSPEKSILAATLSLGNRLHRRRAVCYITGEGEKEPFETIRSALRGKGVFLGDPSILVERAGRYFLHLSATRAPKPSGSHRRILGVDLGISGPIAAMFAIEVKKGLRKKKLGWGDYALLESEIISSDEFRRMWFGLLRKRARRASRVMRGRGGAVKGQRLSGRTALGESLHTERSKQFVYYIVNRALDTAERLGCGVVAFESLRSFRGLLRGKKKYRKSLGHRYNQCLKRKKHAEAEELLQKLREVRKQIKLLQALPWGRFAEDVRAEAAWRGILALPVPAARTSRACPRCGHISEENRRGRGFRCVNCGFAMQADLLGALNIACAGYEKFKHAERQNKEQSKARRT